MFGRRRRPLLRAAMVGGVAYHAGKRRQDTIEQDEVNEARLQQLTAPIAGLVQQLAVHTVGGVVTPAQSLLVIVPTDSHLEIQAIVSNRDVGFVRVGAVANDMGLPALWQPIGVADLQRRSVVHLTAAHRSWWRPASRHPNIVGPLVFTRVGDTTRVVQIPAARASSLCGRRIDWLEI